MDTPVFPAKKSFTALPERAKHLSVTPFQGRFAIQGGAARLTPLRIALG